MDGSSGEVPEAGPPQRPETAEELFRLAEEARHRGVWEEAIRFYRFSLQKEPFRPEAMYGLALSFEAKAQEPGYAAYREEAAGQYRKMLSLDPSSPKMHDILLAAASKAGLLDELMEKYKARIAQGGDVNLFQDGLRKIQALLLLRAAPVKKELAPPPPLISFLFGFIAPALGALMLIIAVMIRFKGGDSPTAAIVTRGLIKMSFGAFFAFFGYKVFMYWRVSRS